MLSLRGRPTGRLGDIKPALSVELSLRGRPRPLTGDVIEVLSVDKLFLGRPRPRVGDVCTCLSSEESLRGRPGPRLGDVIMAGPGPISTVEGCIRSRSLSDVAAVVENTRARILLTGSLMGSDVIIEILTSKGCSAVLLTGDVAELWDRSCRFEAVACGTTTESSLPRYIQSSPGSKVFTGSALTCGLGSAISSEL
jgi:hypothetical protein